MINHGRLKTGSLFLVLLVLLLSSCFNKKPPIVSDSVDVAEYPVRVIDSVIRADLSSQTPLYPLSEEFTKLFLHQANNYEGEHSHIHEELPAKWGLVCVERLPEGREMWMIQSENREWIYLIITSGLGTQRILDLIPVALNLAVQRQDILETETWSARRESDGSFTVSKHYEWTRSLGETSIEEISANPENWQKINDFADNYIINDFCRFDYKKIERLRYKMVFFYSQKMAKPSEWDETVAEIASYCEEKNIFYDEIYTNFNQAIVRDFKLNELKMVDLVGVIGESYAGMIMLSSEEPPRKVEFDTSEKLKVEIKRYFKLLNQ